MMVSSENCAERFKGASYQEMIKERDNLFGYIKNFENIRKTGNVFYGEEDMIDPQPDVIYQTYMDYLAELLVIMRNKYNEDYVCGHKKLFFME